MFKKTNKWKTFPYGMQSIKAMLFRSKFSVIIFTFFPCFPCVIKEVGMKGDLSLFLKDQSLTAELLHT